MGRLSECTELLMELAHFRNEKPKSGTVQQEIGHPAGRKKGEEKGCESG